ncbi:MAG TPA: hypothetical protein VL173_01865 [Vicinamibacterales bacterium]|jgi:hypothetical protein|nr:hypothetical protein [Vicinamibacterales bacterium]
MEVSLVRKRLKAVIDAARDNAQRRRQRVADAERAYDTFLNDVATPVARQVANALKAEGYSFTVFTPGSGLRLASDRTRDDFIEFALDTAGDRAEVIGRVSRQRGSRTIDEEMPVKRGAAPDTISEEDVLEFFAAALEPWLER